MTPEELQTMVKDTLLAAQKEIDDAAEAKRLAEEQRQQDIDTAVATALKDQAKEFAKSRRLPERFAPQNGNGGIVPGAPPYATAFHDTRKYDRLGVEDQAFLCGVLDAARKAGRSQQGVTESALKALAIKIAEDKSDFGDVARSDLKAAGLDPADVLHSTKANELDYTTQAGFGDEWVGIEYSRRLWEAIRAGTFVTMRLPSIEVPQGAESITIPLEAADPTWYKVGQTTALNATTGRPDATITASKLATANKTLTLAKLGARTVYSGEMEEDSLIPWAAQLRRQMEKSGSQALETAVIDGDTEAGATTNINDIAGTPAGTEVFMLFNGFRKSPLVTTTVNSRSAAGGLTDTDFLETLKLMGVAGLNAADQNAVSFIVDANVYWKVLTLASVKTRDVFTQATLENGALSAIWGYGVNASYYMHASATALKANTAGKVDQDTQGNNTTGAILAVRWDQWLLGFRRRLTLEIQRYAEADSNQIVALTRVGLAQRDTEASSITYNVGV